MDILEDKLKNEKEEFGRLYREKEYYKELALSRRGIVKSLRDEMGIPEDMDNDAELKAALEYVKDMKERVKKAENVIEEVLNDSESKDGGWGPDTTMRGVLQDALSDLRGSSHPQ